MKKKHNEPKDTATIKQESQKEEVSGEQSEIHNKCLETIKTLEARLEEANDKFLRLFSEFDNYRKRTAKERIELSKMATADIITALLPVLDDLERGSTISATSNGNELNDEGIMLILNKFKAILRQKGVEEIESVGEEFNTDFHDAVTHIPANDDQQKGIIVEELQKGYLLNGKVIRFARVVVAN